MVSGPKRVDIAFDAVSAMAQSNRSKAAAARVRPLSSAGQAARSRWDQGFESGFLQRGVGCELDTLGRGRVRGAVGVDGGAVAVSGAPAWAERPAGGG